MPVNPVDEALNDALTHSIVAKGSHQLIMVRDKHAKGKVVVYGESGTRATRTEIKLRGAKVIIHRNPLQATGMFAAAGLVLTQFRL